jgi:thiol-disulfide isomerase/thioredoxin
LYMKKIDILPGNEQMFNDEIGRQPIFVKFYMDGCPHCENMKPDWASLEDELLSNYDGDFTIMSVNARSLNDITNPIVKDVQGFPTLFMINKDGSKGANYEGERTKEDMLNFIIKNTGNIIQKKQVYTGGNKTRRHSRYTNRKRQKRSKSKSRRNKFRGGKNKRTLSKRKSKKHKKY